MVENVIATDTMIEGGAHRARKDRRRPSSRSVKSSASSLRISSALVTIMGLDSGKARLTIAVTDRGVLRDIANIPLILTSHRQQTHPAERQRHHHPRRHTDVETVRSVCKACTSHSHTDRGSSSVKACLEYASEWQAFVVTDATSIRPKMKQTEFPRERLRPSKLHDIAAYTPESVLMPRSSPSACGRMMVTDASPASADSRAGRRDDDVAALAEIMPIVARCGEMALRAAPPGYEIAAALPCADCGCRYATPFRIHAANREICKSIYCASLPSCAIPSASLMSAAVDLQSLRAEAALRCFIIAAARSSSACHRRAATFSRRRRILRSTRRILLCLPCPR